MGCGQLVAVVQGEQGEFAMSQAAELIRFDDNAEVSERIAARYPREEYGLTIVPMVASDWPMLEQFLADTPAEEQRFFRRGASDRGRVERWCRQLDYRHTLPLLAWQDDRIVADGVLERESGLWTSHVGKLRLLVHAAHRRRGLGQMMLRELIAVAAALNLHKLVYECAAEQQSLIALLKRLRFHEAARLPEFIRDFDGRLHDLVVMVHDLG
jgi:RimJ/RimL family protein N-acetyltransferase